MIRMIVAASFWGLVVSLAASKYALGLAIPLGLLLAVFGLKLLTLGMPVGVFLVIVAVLWSVAVLDIGFQGIRALRRDQPDEASRKWTLCISLVGLALTFSVAIQSSRSSLDSIQAHQSYSGHGDASSERTKWFAKKTS